MSDTPLETRVERSTRARRTSSARLIDGVLVVRVPAWMTERAVEAQVAAFQKRFERRRRLEAIPPGMLEARTRAVNRRWFTGRFQWTSIEFVTNQTTLHGSCSPATGRIRIAEQLTRVPPWVLDYVIAHELVHLEHRNHSTRFWDAVAAYPLTERARGYLMALSLEPAAGQLEEPAGDAGLAPGQQTFDLR